MSLSERSVQNKGKEKWRRKAMMAENKLFGSAEFYKKADRYRTGGIISLHQADRSCQGGDIPLLVEEGTVA